MLAAAAKQSRHRSAFSWLIDAGIVKKRRQGKWIYPIGETAVRKLLDIAEALD